MVKKSKFDTAQQLAGTKKVFFFTFNQFFKSRANIASMIIMFVLCLVSAPLSSLMTGSYESVEHIYEDVDTVPKTIYIYNTTGIPLSEDNPIIKKSPFANCSFINLQSVNEKALEKTDVLVELTLEESSMSYSYLLKTSGDSSELNSNTLDGLSYTVKTAFEYSKYSILGLDSQTVNSLLTSGYYGNVADAKDFLSSDNQSFEIRYSVSLIYSIIILMLSTLSSSYIIRAVVEEKSSKLVEFLLVNVRPLALIAGKILAIMISVLSMIALMIGGFIISDRISTKYLGLTGIADTLSSIGVNLDSFNLGLPLFVTVIISVIFAYFTFSILSGIAGACCNSMDEMSSASLGAIAPAMAGYIITVIASTIESRTVDTVMSLLPVINLFYAPSAYLLGNISTGVLILSLVIQGAVAALLALFCKRVYSYIIMYKGSKLSIKALLSLTGKEA